MEQQYPSERAREFDLAEEGKKPEAFEKLVEERARKIGIKPETLMAMLGHNEFELRQFVKNRKKPNKEMNTPLQVETMFKEAEMEHTSLMDGLTGVFNRRFLEIRFRELQQSAIRHLRDKNIKPEEKHKTFSCIMIDIDNFKKI